MNEMKQQAIAVLTHYNQISLANKVRAGVTLSDVLFEAAKDKKVSEEQRERYIKMASNAYLYEIAQAAKEAKVHTL